MKNQPLKITDLNGFELEIDNLQLAIMQADDYRHYERLDPKYKDADAERKAYWQDLYQKLVQL
ncbi:hypothetical protein [Mucilaginibacter sp. UR6-11]|uniref:hypothetical protein n=1 Tax=Mucilaginibacter sp. UR6-11 TaxID=1435644 RepID=UPI001E3FD9EF|nr:hypothetical protein [Mucilaginibacter sp. UR6-11]MCC8423551.1 hypothetical protein [Mucilaginibacter sp. UR6-11]